MSERRRNPSLVDQRRLRDGAAAMALGEPRTRAELEATITSIEDGIRALQSTDDLGTDEENEACWQDMLTLERRLERYRTQLADWRGA